MNGAGQLWTLIWTFGLMSLFAVGGAVSAIPEMHRVAVDVNHWMTEWHFADVFAISQLSPGPNVLIVTLIGYSVAGIFGALAATLAMCGPTAILAWYVSGLLKHAGSSRWPAIIQAGLVPLSIGLMAASALILARTSDLDGHPDYNCRSRACHLHQVQSVVDDGSRGPLGFCWRYLTKIASKIADQHQDQQAGGKRT